MLVFFFFLDFSMQFGVFLDKEFGVFLDKEPVSLSNRPLLCGRKPT